MQIGLARGKESLAPVLCREELAHKDSFAPELCERSSRIKIPRSPRPGTPGRGAGVRGGRALNPSLMRSFLPVRVSLPSQAQQLDLLPVSTHNQGREERDNLARKGIHREVDRVRFLRLSCEALHPPRRLSLALHRRNRPV